MLLCGLRASVVKVRGRAGHLAETRFMSQIAEGSPDAEAPMQTEQMVLELLRQPGDEVTGIYNTGGANRAVERAITAVGLANKIVFIGHA